MAEAGKRADNADLGEEALNGERRDRSARDFVKT